MFKITKLQAKSFNNQLENDCDKIVKILYMKQKINHQIQLLLTPINNSIQALFNTGIIMYSSQQKHMFQHLQQNNRIKCILEYIKKHGDWISLISQKIKNKYSKRVYQTQEAYDITCKFVIKSLNYYKDCLCNIIPSGRKQQIEQKYKKVYQNLKIYILKNRQNLQIAVNIEQIIDQILSISQQKYTNTIDILDRLKNYLASKKYIKNNQQRSFRNSARVIAEYTQIVSIEKINQIKSITQQKIKPKYFLQTSKFVQSSRTSIPIKLKKQPVQTISFHETINSHQNLKQKVSLKNLPIYGSVNQQQKKKMQNMKFISENFVEMHRYLDLNKQNLIQYIGSESKSQELFNQLTIKNKFNDKQIREFRQKVSNRSKNALNNNIFPKLSANYRNTVTLKAQRMSIKISVSDRKYGKQNRNININNPKAIQKSSKIITPKINQGKCYQLKQNNKMRKQQKKQQITLKNQQKPKINEKLSQVLIQSLLKPQNNPQHMKDKYRLNLPNLPIFNSYYASKTKQLRMKKQIKQNIDNSFNQVSTSSLSLKIFNVDIPIIPIDKQKQARKSYEILLNNQQINSNSLSGNFWK